MTLRDFSSGNWIGLAAMTAVALLLGVLLGKMRGPQYRPSPSREAAPEIAVPGSTNKSEGPALVRKDGLKLLEEELSRSLKQFAPLSSPQDSLESRTQPPPIRQANVSRRKKDAEDAKRDLIFMSPEDLAKAPTIEEALGLPEFDEQGREKPRLSAMERYFTRLDEKEAAQSSRASRSDPFGAKSDSEESGSDSRDDSLPDSLKNSEQALRKALASNGSFDSLFRAAPDSRSGETAGSDSPGFRHQQALAADPNNSWVQQYRQMLQAPLTTGGTDFQNPFAPGRPGASSTVDYLAPSSVRRDAEPLPLGTLKPFSTDSSFGDPSQRVLNQWDPYYKPPTQEYKRIAPPRPTFEAPRRKF